MAFDRETLKPKYRLEIGRAGESCAFYIAKSLGMPADMLRRASQAAYGENSSPDIMDALPEQLERRSAPVIQKEKIHKNHQTEADAFRLGDCVMVYPDKKTGIVCRTANEKGVLQVQLQDKKIWRIMIFPLSSKAWRRGKRNTRWSVNTVKEWRELYHPQTDCGIL